MILLRVLHQCSVRISTFYMQPMFSSFQQPAFLPAIWGNKGCEVLEVETSWEQAEVFQLPCAQGIPRPRSDTNASSWEARRPSLGARSERSRKCHATCCITSGFLPPGLELYMRIHRPGKAVQAPHRFLARCALFIFCWWGGGWLLGIFSASFV